MSCIYNIIEKKKCGPESLNVYGFDAQAKINVFYQLALLSNNLVLISYQVVFTLNHGFLG